MKRTQRLSEAQLHNKLKGYSYEKIEKTRERSSYLKHYIDKYRNSYRRLEMNQLIVKVSDEKGFDVKECQIRTKKIMNTRQFYVEKKELRAYMKGIKPEWFTMEGNSKIIDQFDLPWIVQQKKVCINNIEDSYKLYVFFFKHATHIELESNTQMDLNYLLNSLDHVVHIKLSQTKCTDNHLKKIVRSSNEWEYLGIEMSDDSSVSNSELIKFIKNVKCVNGARIIFLNFSGEREEFEQLFDMTGFVEPIERTRDEYTILREDNTRLCLSLRYKQ